MSGRRHQSSSHLFQQRPATYRRIGQGPTVSPQAAASIRWIVIIGIILLALTAVILGAVAVSNITATRATVQSCEGTCVKSVPVEETVAESSTMVISVNSPPGVNVSLSTHCFSSNTAGHDVLFLHGFFHSWLMWVNQIGNATLKSAHNLYTMDWRGMGESDMPFCGTPETSLPMGLTLPDIYSADAYADDVHNTIDQLSLNKPVIVAHSAAVFLLADYFRKYGFGEVSGFVIFGSFSEAGTANVPSLIWTPEIVEWASNGAVFVRDLRIRAPAIRRFIDLGLACTLGADETRENFLITNSFPTPDVINAIFTRAGPENADLWANVTIPACVIHGKLEQVIKFSWGETLASQIPGVTFLPVDAGHLPNLEIPGEFNDALLNFMAGIPIPP